MIQSVPPTMKTISTAIRTFSGSDLRLNYGSLRRGKVTLNG
jgi:hypothetical protein